MTRSKVQLPGLKVGQSAAAAMLIEHVINAAIERARNGLWARVVVMVGASPIMIVRSRGCSLTQATPYRTAFQGAAALRTATFAVRCDVSMIPRSQSRASFKWVSIWRQRADPHDEEADPTVHGGLAKAAYAYPV